MRRKKTELQQHRIYSIELKKAVVSQIESGELSVIQACRVYGVKGKQTIYNWIYKYSRTLKKTTRIVVEKDSVDKRLKELEDRNRLLEAALGRKQMELDLYLHIVQLASEEYGVDLKKSFGEEALKDTSK
jgi:transposase-like protein